MQTVDFKHIELSDGDKLLDLGCGEGRHVIAAVSYTHLTLPTNREV